MKINILFLLFASLFLLPMNLDAQSEKILQTKITNATVFMQGAQLVHAAEASLPAGETVLLVKGLSPFLDDNSVQVKGKGKFTILSVESRKNYLQNLDEAPEVKTILLRIRELEASLEDHQLAIGIWKEKEAFLTANKVVSGKENSVDAAAFRLLFDFYSQGIQQSRTEIQKRERSIKEISSELAGLRQQLEESRIRIQQPSQEIKITVKAESAVNVSFELSYFNPRASWIPLYDIRADRTDKPVNMIYRAKVMQNTGVDWNGVKLTLSNANPNRSGTIPKLYPYYLNFPVETYRYDKIGTESRKAAPAAAMELQEIAIADDNSLALEVMVNENTTSTSFTIAVPYVVPSGGDGKTIDILSMELPASFTYRCTPKLDRSAFLAAGIYNWEQYDLLPGQSNIYFENTFVGQAWINPAQTSDTLLLSLGRDQAVVVNREKRKEFTSSRMIGTNKVDTRSWTISVRNTKNSPIQLVLNDQVPVSNNKEITVEVQELSGGKLNSITGEVEWKFELKPNETKTIILSYSVKYPKDKELFIQ